MQPGPLVYWGQHRRGAQELYYSGTIEATQANIAFQAPGRVSAVLVDEGQSVKAGQILARLDPDAFSAGRSQAEAVLVQAQANQLRLEAVYILKKAALPAEVQRAEAAVQSLEYQYKELSGGYRPQEVEKARLATAEAQSALDKARRQKARFDTLFQQKVISESDKDAVDLRYETSLSQYQQARQGRESGPKKDFAGKPFSPPQRG